MPLYDNADCLLERIEQCNTELYKLHQEQSINYAFKAKLAQIKAFYERAFDNTLDEEEGMSIVNQYEHFIIVVTEVKLGQLTAEEAYESIQDVATQRKIDIIFHNFLKLCELLFWTGVIAISYATSLVGGIPLLLLEPLIGLGVIASTSLLCMVAVSEVTDCFKGFKVFDPVNDEHVREKQVISFFGPQPPQIVSRESPNHSEELIEQDPTAISCT